MGKSMRNNEEALESSKKYEVTQPANSAKVETLRPKPPGRQFYDNKKRKDGDSA